MFPVSRNDSAISDYFYTNLKKRHVFLFLSFTCTSHQVVNNDTLRAIFVSNLLEYIDTNDCDGLDLDWEYPAQRGGIESDKVCKPIQMLQAFI